MRHEHTQGKWQITIAPLQVTCDKKIVCDFQQGDYPLPNGTIDAEHIANARLIALAPEMLEVLEDCWNALNSLSIEIPCEPNKEWQDYLKAKIEKVISKAKGKL